MHVYKAGGTSNGSRDAIEQYATLLLQDSLPKVTVQSAISGVTNLLLMGAAGQIEVGKFPSVAYDPIRQKTIEVYGTIPGAEALIECHFQELDSRIALGGKNRIIDEDQQRLHRARIASWGEWSSAQLFTHFLTTKGVRANYVDSKECMFLTGNPTNAEYDRSSDALIREQVKNLEVDVHVFGGYWGLHPSTKEFMVFDRGGSDYTQTLIMRALNAKRGYNCTDVNGIMPIDPRLLPEESRKNLKTIPELSYQEMQELARKGARVLHPRCIEPLIENELELYVLNTFNLHGPQSRIGSVGDKTPRITAVTGKKENYLTLTLRTGLMEGQTGFFTGVAEAFEGVNIEAVTTSHVGISVSFSDPSANLEAITRKLSALGTVTLHNHSSMIAMVGRGLGSEPRFLSQFFATLAEENIPVGQVTKSDNFSLWVSIPTEKYETALRALYRDLILQAD